MPKHPSSTPPSTPIVSNEAGSVWVFATDRGRVGVRTHTAVLGDWTSLSPREARTVAIELLRMAEQAEDLVEEEFVEGGPRMQPPWRVRITPACWHFRHSLCRNPRGECECACHEGEIR